MLISNFLLILLLQTPQTPPPPVIVTGPPQASAGQTVIVSLDDGMKVTIENPEYTGFIEGRNGDAVLIYHERNFHGEMPLKTIARIEFGPYKRGKPFPLKVTLRNGEELIIESERRDFVTIRGRSEFGTVTIRNPDPINAPAGLNPRKADRKKDLTIQYLEFPAS